MCKVLAKIVEMKRKLCKCIQVFLRVILQNLKASDRVVAMIFFVIEIIYIRNGANFWQIFMLLKQQINKILLKISSKITQMYIFPKCFFFYFSKRKLRPRLQIEWSYPDIFLQRFNLDHTGYYGSCRMDKVWICMDKDFHRRLSYLYNITLRNIFKK